MRNTNIFSAAAISFVVLGLAIFLGEDMYHADGLFMLEPHDKQTFIIQYCWSNLQTPFFIGRTYFCTTHLGI